MSKTSTAAAAHRTFKRSVMAHVQSNGSPAEHDSIDEVLKAMSSTGNRPSLNWVAKVLKNWRRQMTVEQRQRAFRTLSGSRIQRAEAFA